MLDYTDYRGRRLQDRELRDEYDALGLASAISEEIMMLRALRNITQRELADLVGTQQSSISRIEQGTHKPSLSFLERIAESLDADIQIRLVPRK